MAAEADKLDLLAGNWTRLGATFGGGAALETPDVERLLLDTARCAHARSRLLIMAATWLARYSCFVDAHRLAHLIRSELEPEYRPTIGLLLDWARANGGGDCLDPAIDACGEAIDARPLCDLYSDGGELARVAEAEATPLSKKWGRWMSETRLRGGALRSRDWIVRNNPVLCSRSH